MEKICEFCGETYTASLSNQKYCSDKCRRETDKKNKREKHRAERGIQLGGSCIVCGSEIIGKSAGSKYCSDYCAWKHHRMKSGKCNYGTVESVCINCGNKVVGRFHQKYCSEKCRNSNKPSGLKRFDKDKIIDTDITVKSLYKRDKGVCYLCGGLCNLDDYIVKDGYVITGDWYPSVDHVIPRKHGGEHSWDNVKLAHRICNIRKSDKIIGE